MRCSSTFCRLAAVTVGFMMGAAVSRAEVVEKHAKVSGVSLDFKVILPNHFDAAKPYPGVLAFPGGSQAMQMVDGMIDRNLREQAEKRGYIVVIPSAPGGVLFFEGSEKIFPAFLNQILAEYKIQGGKFNMAGISSGDTQKRP